MQGLTNLCHLDEIKLVDVEDASEGVAGVSVQVRPVAVLGGLVEVVVLADQLLKLALDVEDLVLGEVVFDHGDLGSLEMGQKADLVGLDEEERTTLGVVATGGTADTVDVVAGIIRRIELDNPVDGGDIETSGSNVRADKGSLLGVAELEEGVCALLLLLFAVEIENLEIDVLQKLRVVLDTVAGREEDDDLLLLHLLQEREKQKESLVGLDDDVTLVETLYSRELLLLVDVDVKRTGTQRDTGEIFDLGGLGGGEEHGLAVILGQDLDDLAHFVFETDFENTIGLVDDEGAQVLENKGGVLEICNGNRLALLQAIGEAMLGTYDQGVYQG